MIDYQLFSELKAAIEDKYSSTYEMYSEDPHKTYNDGIVWDNYGIRIVCTNFTIAVLCEYDQNEPTAAIYVGVKVLDADKDAVRLTSHLNAHNSNGQTYKKGKGAHKRLFSWPYWKSVTTVNEGLFLFDKLFKDCNDFLFQQIF